MDRLFRSETLFRTLGYLALAEGEEQPIEELATFAATSRPAVLMALHTLGEMEMVLRRRQGRRYYYRANLEHPLYPELLNIAHKTLRGAEAA